MKAKNNSRKGFTIVELVIVIAVVAVLAAVLIPTFVSLVNKANDSADVQMVTNINKYLAALEITEGKNVTMHDAVQDAKAAGYDLTKLTSTNTILWNSQTDRFLVVNGKNKILASDENATWGNDNKADKKKVTPSYIYWGLYSEIPAEQDFSIYFIGNTISDVTVTVGFDAGNYTGNFKLTYDNSRSADEIIILRTNCGSLEVKSNVTVSHYGYAKELTLNDSAVRYSEYGYLNEITASNYSEFNAVSAHFCKEKATVETLITNMNVSVAHYQDHVDNGEGNCLLCGNAIHVHVIGEMIEIQKQDCTHDGISYSQCSCGYIKFENAPQLGHDYSIVMTEDLPATCEYPGHTKGLKCSRCGDQKVPEYIHQLNHDFVNGVCTNCNAKYSDKTINAEMIQTALDNGKSLLDENGTGYFQLAQDIDLTVEQFNSLFTVEQSYAATYWDKDREEWVTPEHELSIPIINILDIDLNGYTLTIDWDGKSPDPIYSEYFFRVNDTSTSKGTVNFKNSYYNSPKGEYYSGYPDVLCSMAGAKTEVIFENVIVEIETGSAVYLGFFEAGVDPTLTVTNCELKYHQEGQWYSVWTNNKFYVTIDDYSREHVSKVEPAQSAE